MSVDVQCYIQVSDLNFYCLVSSLVFPPRQTKGQLYHLEKPKRPAKCNVDEKIIGCQEKLGSNISESSKLLENRAIYLTDELCSMLKSCWNRNAKGSASSYTGGHEIDNVYVHPGQWCRVHLQPFICVLLYQLGEEKAYKLIDISQKIRN